VPRLEALEDRTLLSTYTVNTLTDTGAGSGRTGDLRYCITHATSGSDTISFAAGLTGTIQLQNDLPILKASVAIQGPGPSKLTVAGYEGNQSIIFNVGSTATVQIYGLTLAHAGDDAIYNYGSVVVSNITFTGDGLYDSGYAIASFGSATVSNSIFADNNGGVYNEENKLSVSNCTFSGNYDTAINTGGSATVSDSTFSGNLAEALANGGYLTVNNCTLSNNGLALSNYHETLTVNNSTISDNSNQGIYNFSGSVTINNSTIYGNKAVGSPAYSTAWTYGASGGGGVYPGGNGVGGGIYMAGGTLSINSSTIADNEAEGGSSAGVGPGLAGSGIGGGLYIGGGTVTINNSTLAGNLASGGGGSYPGSGNGGGIYNAAGPGALQMYDTILADNSADTAGPDLDGSITSLGHNLIGNTTGGSGFAASDLLNVNPQLGPPQNNGGPTQTLALQPGSPAIDAGDNTNAPTSDQRGPGYPRIVNGIIDIGAFEVQNGSANQASSLAVTGFSSSITAGSAGSFTVTALNADGTIDAGYTGTVHFTSSDGQAVLPADYTFIAADGGVHTFTAALKTAGTQSLTAADTATASVIGREVGIEVNPAAASKLILTAPSSVNAGAAFSLTLTVEDAFSNVVNNYTGTVHFSSTDTRATLPRNYTFTASDKGMHTFTGLVLRKKGFQTITITDTHKSSLTGSITVDVL
jgi:hypothetical protein